MQFEPLNEKPNIPRGKKEEIINAIAPVLTGEIAGMKIRTINSHRSTIQQALDTVLARTGIELEATVVFRHDRRAGDLADAGTATRERAIDAYVWKKESGDGSGVSYNEETKVD